ncbi:hypothetical protein TNCV_1467871 [Trichonephila clavipes]|uniref:RNA-directed DNA polymerase from mobile element jockey n=1 Tax=Trichonephila clavipes TaxID=2585209 RepID=A0A8X6RZQ9_TRICX|nr:hypothetical protein TNCV_1467871 [Trichonephila clavipes]
MANLPTDMELELEESHRNATRTPSPQLTPCEQLKYNKAQLAQMETFRRCKQACVDALMMMPDHHPDEPFCVRALTELHDIEETMALANSHLSIENKVLLYTAVMRPIVAYACPVWGYATKTNINILDTLQNSLIRMIVKAIRYMRNDDILVGKSCILRRHVDGHLPGFMKDCVYVPPLPADLSDLRHRMEADVARISSGTLKKVWDELIYRLDVCLRTH